MAMASLNASLLAPKGGAQPAARAPTMAPSPTARYAAIGQISNGSTAKQNNGKSLRQVRPEKLIEGKQQEKKTKKKSLRLSARMDKDLRLLAVRNGLSQQALLEQAVSDYLDRAYAEGDCICRR